MQIPDRLGKWTLEESNKHSADAYEALRSWDGWISFYNTEHNPKLEATVEKVARPIVKEYRALMAEHYWVRKKFKKLLATLASEKKISKPRLALPGLVKKRQWSGIVWHHSATKDGQTYNWPAIKRHHVEVNGWSDIGYHMGIEYANDSDGLKPRLMMGRSLERGGAHTYFVANGQKIREYNEIYIGLCAVGNFDATKPPEEIWDMCLQLTRSLQDLYGISTDRVFGHWETYLKHGIEALKTCPGKFFDIDRFREEL